MINLLSPEVKKERIFGRQNRSLLGYSVALIVTAISIMGIMTVGIQFVGSDEANLKEEISKADIEILALEKNIKAIESIATRLDTAKKVNDLSVRFSELIPEIGAVLPEGVILNALSLTGGITDPLQLDVSLTSAGLAAILIRNLVESDLFEAADVSTVTPGSSAVTTDGNEDEILYKSSASLTASFTGSAEIKRKIAAQAAALAAAQAAAAEAAALEAAGNQ